MVCDIAVQRNNEDGWISIGQGANLFRQYAPEQFDTFREIYGYKTLKNFMRATHMFKVLDESSPKDGLRILYRLMPSVD